MVAFLVKGRDQFIQDLLVVADCQALHILEHEGAGVQFADNPNEFEHKPVSRIIKDTMANQGKALAWSTPKS